MNDGAEWAGRGLASTVEAGARVETSWLSASLTPVITYSRNEPFEVLPSNAPGRSQFASPWHSGIESADQPLRFGTEPITTFYPGQSWIELRRGPLAFGVSSDDQWWGPGIQNALVLSNNAAGIPEAHLRSTRPIPTPVGDVEFRWFVGALTQSTFFDTARTGGLRAISAAAATLRTRIDSGLTVGVARAVYSPVGSAHRIPAHAFDVFSRWNQTPDLSGAPPAHPSDQVLSLFWRWIFPESGFEFYGEWAKLFPPGLREMLVAPQLHQGFTLGTQWVAPVRGSSAVRLQAEATMLEQTPAVAHGPVASFYTSRFVPQGYTQRGQVIGAAIGPGASAQFLAGDYLTSRWRIGVELGRIRWEDDAYYQSPNGISFLAHDVSLYAGLRGSLTLLGYDVWLEAIPQQRLNYLFQSAVSGYAPDRGFDVHNTTLRLTLSPR